METRRKKRGKKEPDSFSLISLYLRGFLRRESLAENDMARKLLEKMEGGLVHNEEEWAGALRKCLTWNSTRDLCVILARPLCAVELLFLFESVDEFVSLTRGRVTAIVEKERISP